MNRVVPQVQQAPQLPRAQLPQPHHEIINLLSDDEDEPENAFDSDSDEDESGSESAGFEDGELFVDAPQAPVQQQDQLLGFGQRGAVFNIVDLMDAELPQFMPPAPAPARPDNPPPARRQVWGDYIIDDEFDDAEIAQLIEDDLGGDFFADPPAPRERPSVIPHPQAVPALAAPIPQQPQASAPAEPKDECIQTVAAVFPGICLDHVAELYNKIAKSSERLIAHLLDQMDKGIVYPKAKDKAKDLKRKRVVDENEEAARKYGAPDRVVSANVAGIRPYIRTILSHEYPSTPMAFIDATLSQSGHRLFSAYQLLDEASRTYNPLTSLYTKIKTARKGHIDFGDDSIEAIIAEPNGDLERADTLRELRAARKYKAKADEKREAERAAALAEEENEIKAQAEGTMKECACCFGDYPLNRMVHCDAEVEMHWFCRGCALRNAETEVGQSKYELCCMSMEGCDAKFTLSQRAQFLDEKTKIALERNEQEANLRLAGIENLASCPFCPYAAEYPPVEVDREFRCQAPDCEKISCRLCKLESHIPKSCEENAKETGLSVRRRIEEAMSAALIRKCNKCGTPFIKEEGCNKMRCTLKGCGNVQCYVCSKSCDYDHFDDRGRGGKPGNCPLFESVETRHDEEVSKAEKAALEQVRAEHPEYTEDDLKVKVSENVKKDDEQRRAKDPRLNPGALGGPGAAIFRGLPYQALHALRMDHHHHMMPRPHIVPRRPQPRQVAEDPLLPALAALPDQDFGGEPLLREPYLGPGGRPGDANAPNFDHYFDDIVGGIDIMPWGNDFRFPPPPPPPPPLPGAAAPAAAGPAFAAAPPPPYQRAKDFNDFLMRRPGNPGDPFAVDQDMDWRDIAGLPQPLAERRGAADNIGQGDEIQDAPPRERLVRRVRLRGGPVDAQEDKDVPEPLRQRLAQVAAAREQTIKDQIRQARAEGGLRIPNFVFPGDLQPPAGDILGPADGNAVAEIQAREAGRRRLEEQINKAAVDLRLARLREITRNDERHKEDRRRRARQNQVQAFLDDGTGPGGVGQDEDGDEDMDFFREIMGTLPRSGNQNNANKGEQDGLIEPLHKSATAARWPPRPAAALRQQQILDHEERRIERSQLMARLRRDQENDEAATARRLAMLRQNNAAAAGPAQPTAAVIQLFSSPKAKKKVDQENLSDLEAGDDEDAEEWDVPNNYEAAARMRRAVMRPYIVPAAGPARQQVVDPLPAMGVKKKVDLMDDYSDPEASAFAGSEDEDEDDYW